MTLLGYTTLRTIKNSEGQNILWHPEHLQHYFYTVVMENFNKLTLEEKHQWFEATWIHKELIAKLYDEPTQNTGCAPESVQRDNRNPIEEYEHLLSIDPDADMTPEQWQLKLEMQRERKEWFEQYIANQ